ncbi:MAG: NAD(P)-dependent oxidoreductase [Solirubrobacteraceae bacterium]
MIARRFGGLVVVVVVVLLAASTGRALARSPWQVTRIPHSRGAASVGEHSPVVAAAADGWAVLTWDRRHHELVALKAPGASRFGVARAFARGGASELGAAVDGRGQAVVAWLSADEQAVKAVRVGVGGVGPVVRLSPLGANLQAVSAPLVAVGPGGRAAVLWLMYQPGGAYVNLAQPGHPLGAPQLVDASSGAGGVEGVYAGFDAAGRLHLSWQEAEGSLRGAVWSRDGDRRAARTLLALGANGAQPAPRALDVATLASGGQLAILSDRAGALLSRQSLGGVFGPLLEQPAPGTVDGAATAATGWALLASSSPGKHDQLLPLLQAIGATIVHVGAAGAGQTAKACNQVLVARTIEAVSETLVLASAAGVDPSDLVRVLRAGMAGSRVLELRGQRMIEHDFEPGFKVSLHAKDLRIALELAGDCGVQIEGIARIEAIFQELIAQGRGEQDNSAMLSEIERRAGAQLARRGDGRPSAAPGR